MERLFRFSTRKKMVAVLDGNIAGYAEPSWRARPKAIDHFLEIEDQSTR
jgi:hypothetical protein